MTGDLHEALQSTTPNLGEAVAAAQGKKPYRIGSLEVEVTPVGPGNRTGLVPPIHAIDVDDRSVCGAEVRHIVNEPSWWDLPLHIRCEACLVITG